MRPQLLERMPALDENEYARNLGVEITAADTTTPSQNGDALPNGAVAQPPQVSAMMNLNRYPSPYRHIIWFVFCWCSNRLEHTNVQLGSFWQPSLCRANS